MFDNMAYDNESLTGDIIAEEYLEEGNPLNPESPFGYFIYRLIGGAFDKMDDMTNRFLQDCSILSTSAESLDDVWGKDLDLPRPSIVDGDGLERLLTDDEYRVYLYVRHCRLMTVEDLLCVFNRCMSTDSYDVYIEKEATGNLKVVDHLKYESRVTDVSDIAAQEDDDSGDIITDHVNDDDVNTVPDYLHRSTDFIIVLYVPMQGWDSGFLALLEEYASIKGNVSIREYSV